MTHIAWAANLPMEKKRKEKKKWGEKKRLGFVCCFLLSGGKRFEGFFIYNLIFLSEVQEQGVSGISMGVCSLFSSFTHTKILVL